MPDNAIGVAGAGSIGCFVGGMCAAGGRHVALLARPRVIQEIEGKLSTAEIIDPSTLPKDGRVVFGAVVDLEDQTSGARLTYQIVGEDEADLKAGRISVTSPIARALVAKSEGDVVAVAAPGGTRSYEIVAVRL